MHLVVDGMNVIGSRPDRWWRDRDAAMRRLVGALGDYARVTGDEITVAFDAKPFDVGEAPGVSIVFAPGGRNAADDAIVRLVEHDAAPATIRVVTSDRDLAERVTALGAGVSPAGELRSELDRLE